MVEQIDGEAGEAGRVDAEEAGAGTQGQHVKGEGADFGIGNRREGGCQLGMDG